MPNTVSNAAWLAIVALCGFVAGGVEGFRHLRSGDRRHDANSYVLIHQSVVFGVAGEASLMTRKG